MPPTELLSPDPNWARLFFDDSENVLTRLPRANLITDIFGGATTICRTLARFKAKGRRMQVALRDGAERVPVIAYPKSEETP